MQVLQILLFPFSVLYQLITFLRNFFYEKGIFETTPPPVRTISVGNLSVGGTGKTPFVAYLIGLIGKEENTAVVSRGYGRKTQGLRIAETHAKPSEIGDEPLQLLLNFPKIRLIVAEKRILTFPILEKKFPEIDYLILDDAYQHRAAGRHLNILLTEYVRPFYQDFVLPAGRLRESRKGAKRASVIIVSKCPPEIGDLEREQIRQKIRPYTAPKTPVFFTKIHYFSPKPIFENSFLIEKQIFLLTGIAHTAALKAEIRKNYEIVEHWELADHVVYDQKKVLEIRQKLELLNKAGKKVSLLTTEKDAVKLRFFENLADLPIFYLPIQTVFLDNEKAIFEEWFRKWLSFAE